MLLSHAKKPKKTQVICEVTDVQPLMTTASERIIRMGAGSPPLTLPQLSKEPEGQRPVSQGLSGFKPVKALIRGLLLSQLLFFQVHLGSLSVLLPIWPPFYGGDTPVGMPQCPHGLHLA